MRWQGRQGSSNIEDRRGGGGGGRGRKGMSIGIGSIILIVIVVLLGGDPSQFLQSGSAPAGQSAPTGVQKGGSAQENELAEFVGVVLKDTEDVWNKLFREQLGKQYREPVLVLFSGSTQSACGHASAATGPFYCPADQRLYIDLQFYQELSQRFGASGDFAMAYVVAHEVAHHVQNLMGITSDVNRQRGRVSKEKYNDLSVRLELQADFLAGVWAHQGQKMKKFLQEGDIEEAMGAANAIGDDRLQMESQGYVVPESFTHGTSEQRMRWFRKGFETGDLRQGDTFSVRRL